MKCSKCNNPLNSKDDSVIINHSWGSNSMPLPLISVYHKECFNATVLVGTILGPSRILIQKMWIYIIIAILVVSPFFLIITQHISLGINFATIAFLFFEAVVLIMTVRSLIAIYGYQKLSRLG